MVLINTSQELRGTIMDTMCVLPVQLGRDFAIFVPMTNKVCNVDCRSRWGIFRPSSTIVSLSRYGELVTRVLKCARIAPDTCPRKLLNELYIRKSNSCVDGREPKSNHRVEIPSTDHRHLHPRRIRGDLSSLRQGTTLQGDLILPRRGKRGGMRISGGGETH